MVASGGPIREVNQDAPSAPRRGEDRPKGIQINRTADTRIFSLVVKALRLFLSKSYRDVRCVICRTKLGRSTQFSRTSCR